MSASVTLAFLASVWFSFPVPRVKAYLVDDRDPQIRYNGTWELKGVQAEYQSTTSLNNIPGGTASLTFSGVQVAVYGSRTSGTYFTRSTYVMDGDNPTVFTAPPESSSTIYGIQFYNSGTLPNTEHTLIITNYGYWFYLDYFDVTTFNPNEPISENDESTLGLQSSALGFLPGAAPTSISALLSSNHQSSRSRMSSSVRASTPLPMPLFIHSYHLKT
ncbi:hypothetical protein NLI96_g12906 [Meripilus lineatus]|uniref:Uncharacterized protein n=1 Tax=Meripilus lineatus TaxID=2056292 RepID=A0AAD5YBY9_9APHY|nr:hypothetical protein NLI96_g12906 [Physisporinus lineatus]